MSRALSSLLLACLCGCCSVQISRLGETDMIKVENENFKFLGLFPIWSGDPEYPNRGVTLWCCDSLLLDVNMMLLDDAMRRHGYTSFRNVTTYKTREDMLFLFSRNKLHTSAELIR